MIVPIQYKSAISIIKEIPTTGHNPLLVISDDYEEYFVKSCKNITPPFYIISEFLCHYFALLWGIPTPDIAAIKMSKSLITDSFAPNHKPSHYERICFGSKKIPDAIEMNAFLEAHRRNKFYTRETILKIGLFDIWVENDDRKPTNANILFAPVQNKLTITAIDHAYTFNSMSYTDLNPSVGISCTFNESILQTPFAKGVYKKVTTDKQEWFKKMEKYYYLCIDKCSQHFTSIAENIPGELGYDTRLQACIKDFLFDTERNKKVFIEFVSRLQ